MDQPFYWDNTHLNSTDSQTFPVCLSSPNNADMDYNNVDSEENEGLSIWSHNPNSDEFPQTQGNHDESKREHGWNAALSINSSANPRIEEMQLERASMFSLENMDINSNCTGAVEGQSFPQAVNTSNLSQDVRSNTYGEIAGTSMPPHIQETSESTHAPSNHNWSSSSGVGLILGDDDGRPRSSLYRRHVACKRKNIEGVTGESSSSETNLLFQQNESNSANPSLNYDFPGITNASGSSKYLPGPNSFGEQVNRALSIREGGVFSEWHQSSSFARNTETSQRNFRIRLNPKGRNDIFPSDSSPNVNNNRLCSPWSHGEPSSLSLNQLPGESQWSIPPIPSLPGHLFSSLNVASSSRTGNSSSQSDSEQRLSDICEETNTRRFQMFFGDNSNHVVLVPPNGNPSNSTVTVRGNEPIASIASSSSEVIPLVNQLPGLIRGQHENAFIHYPRSFSEIISNVSVAPVEPESEHQSTNFSTQYSVQSASLHDSGQTSGGDPPGGSEPHTRSAAFIDRQREVRPGIPLSMRSREGRDRMIFEIRNALDIMRRAENLRSEDSFFRDQSAFFGRADLHDRHRDMRLDVDNMSYEELLALEDRIGYVSTGLTEDAIFKHLKQHKHSPCKLEVASAEQEPCCICREEYSEGEDIGRLGCSHDFHASCIKQWLMIKNLCPICKTTALET